MPLALMVPTAAFPPGIPFTLQLTAVFARVPVESLTVAMKVCGSPSSTEAEIGDTLTEIIEGGSCDGPEPTSPPQPRIDATKIITGSQ